VPVIPNLLLLLASVWLAYFSYFAGSPLVFQRTFAVCWCDILLQDGCSSCEPTNSVKTYSSCCLAILIRGLAASWTSLLQLLLLQCQSSPGYNVTQPWCSRSSSSFLPCYLLFLGWSVSPEMATVSVQCVQNMTTSVFQKISVYSSFLQYPFIRSIFSPRDPQILPTSFHFKNTDSFPICLLQGPILQPCIATDQISVFRYCSTIVPQLLQKGVDILAFVTPKQLSGN